MKAKKAFVIRDSDIRKLGHRLPPSAAQKSAGRIARCAIDTHEFLKGRRMQPEFNREVLKEFRELETRLVVMHKKITGEI